MEANDHGSAKTLRRLVYPLTIFLGEEANPWSYEQKLGQLSKQRAAETWLCQQAAQYHVSLSFHQGGNYGLDTHLTIDNIPNAHGSRNEYNSWVFDLLKKIGWDNPIRLYNQIISETGCNNMHVIIFANDWGRSYSMPFSGKGDQAQYFLEGFFCYRNYEDGQELLTASIAHEILHLYGAWDLYENVYVTCAQSQLASRCFPNDIMHRLDHNINNLIIDELTAWRIGWKTNAEDWYESFRPSYE